MHIYANFNYITLGSVSVTLMIVSLLNVVKIKRPFDRCKMTADTMVSVKGYIMQD